MPFASPSGFGPRLRAPFEVEGQQVFTSASLGIAVSTTGYDTTGGDLLQDAAIALHRAKADGSTAVRVVRPGHARARRVRRLQMETDLRQCDRQRARSTVRYQPIISLATATIEGFEALARWHHPDPRR